MESPTGTKHISRRYFIAAAAAGATALTTDNRKASAQANFEAALRPLTVDLILTNGRFVDYRGATGSTMTIRNGRIQGIDRGIDTDSQMPIIDLGGRTVIPGLVDGHVHYTRAGMNPGHQERRVERAFSISDLQQTLTRRAASTPRGEFITCIGGWNHTQFAENRPPNIGELDGAAPNHPVYLSGTGGGTGAVTNSLGRVFFEANGVPVDAATGAVSSANAAFTALQADQSPDDKLRGTAELNAYANSKGLTAVINSGNLADQEFPLALWRDDRLTVRMRPLFPGDSPEEVALRATNNFSQGDRAVGDDMFRPAGFGERIGGTDTMSPRFEPTALTVARHRWMLQQHSITGEENAFHIGAFRRIAREHPIAGLRWSLIHLRNISDAHLQDLIDLGAGASAQTWTYLSASGGPPFRRIVDSGIRAAVGTDSTNVAPMDPWLAIYYMTTGRNLRGELTNDGQQISRLEALRLYTEGAAWFAHDDGQAGSFDTGKHADLAVLSHDYLRVPDEMIRQIESVLTLVGGRIVHTADPFNRLGA